MRMRAASRPAKHGSTHATARCAAAAALHCYRAPQARRVQSRQALRLTSRSSRTYPLPAQEGDQASHSLQDSGRRAAGPHAQAGTPFCQQHAHQLSVPPQQQRAEASPVEPKVSMAKNSPSSILVASPPCMGQQRSTASEAVGSRQLHAAHHPSPSSKLHDQASTAMTTMFPPRPRSQPQPSKGPQPWTRLDDGHRLAGVDAVGADGVAVQVADALHLRQGCGPTVRGGECMPGMQAAANGSQPLPCM